MMFKKVFVEIRGISPLLMHNKQLADPLNKWTVKMKEITSKRAKTESDHARLAELEWNGSLYLNDAGQPVIPGEMIEGMYAAAATKKRKKAVSRAGLMSNGLWPLSYKGPKSADDLWDNQNFRFVAIVSPQGKNSKIVRTLPRFAEWGLSYEVEFDPGLINHSEVEDWTQLASRYCGLGDFRPRYGRFEVVSITAGSGKK